MKKKIYIIFALLFLFCIPLHVFAVERNFPAGSLIIPMDSNYQKDDDGGILEAYGLAFYLLDHKTDSDGDGDIDDDDENDITVYWIINDQKVELNGIDFQIQDSSLSAPEVVSALYNHVGGADTTSILTYKTGDDFQTVTYTGAPFIVDGADAVAAKEVIALLNWDAVEVHEAQVPFAAPVYREMKGTPPRIALMNDKEADTGNAAILESYLRLAGICTDIYDVVTPNQIRDNVLVTGDYDFLWAPHWTGYDSYDVDNDGNGINDVEDIVIKIKEFLENGKGLLAECASIEVFEHSQNGRFLSTKGFGHNEGTNDSDYIIYNDITMPNSQIGDFEYVPEGGHLHNWRPFEFGDDYNFDTPPDELPAGDPDVVTEGNPSTYVETVTRFTIDRIEVDGEDVEWDYYVGGYAYGDTSNGYAVYLGGHKYADCKDSTKEATTEPGVHPVLFEFEKNIDDEEFTLHVDYDSGSNTTIEFNASNLTTKIDGDPLQIDLTGASINKKKLENAVFRNIGASTITINSITTSWTGGDAAQKLKKIQDMSTDVKHLDDKTDGKKDSGDPVNINGSDFTISSAAGSGSVSNCSVNSDCSWKNIAGVRYVLNTLFNIKFQISSREYVRSAPIVLHPYVYQGSFEYPSYYGHFRKYNVEAEAVPVGDEFIDTAEWDTADKINDALTGNFDPGARQVFTSQLVDEATNEWGKIDFDVDEIDLLRTPLDITPTAPVDGGDDADEIRIINKLRGIDEDGEFTKKFGGIMHSAPVIVTQNSRTGSTRDELAYVGDVYGMLHAINIDSGDEEWAFIPNNLLGLLQNDRTDPNAGEKFAAVDGSPTAMDVYYSYDDDNNPITPEVEGWRTILICSEGMGGNSIFALDITDPDPDEFSVLWEITDPAVPDGFDPLPGGGMGHSFRVSIGKVKWPVYEVDGVTIDHYTLKWVVFTATGFLDYSSGGGINTFAFDLKTGEMLWYFSAEYEDSVNDIPGAITIFDTTGDTFVDRVFVGDMNGRLWELDAETGVNPHGTEEIDGVVKQIPLWNAGIGNPISVSPAVVSYNHHVILVFGTGGTDWAANDQNYSVFAINASNLNPASNYADGAGTLLWGNVLAVGEKVWSSPTIAAGTIFVTTATGTMESSDPRADIAGTGKLYAIKLAPDDDGFALDAWVDAGDIDGIEVGKARGSIFVDRGHLYLTTTDNEIKQIGDGDFTDPNVNLVILRSWRQD
jgi:PilY1 beta-propeller domain